MTTAQESGRETYTFSADKLSDRFTFGFRAKPSRSYSTSYTNTLAIDNIALTADAENITKAPNLVIQSTSGTQTNNQLTITTTIQNTGSASAGPQTITVYRHTSETDTPRTGTNVGTTTTRTLNPNDWTTQTIQTTIPSPTQETATYHYYTCVSTAGCTLSASITVQPEEEETAPNITVQTTATPTTATPGQQITVRATVTNTGTTPTPSQPITAYRHNTETDTPTTGGTRLASGTTGTLQPGAATTRSTRTSAPTVTTETTYHYYMCVTPAPDETDTADNCASAQVTVSPEEEEEEEEEDTTQPNLTIQATATPQTATSGDRITLRATIRNTGTASATPQTITAYRHTRTTQNPRTGTAVGTATTGTLQPSATATRTIRITAPTVSTQTTYHYYVCIATACASVQVTVQPETVVEPDITLPEVMGGDPLRGHFRASEQNYRTDKPTRDAATLTLGGLTTADGTKGFVMSGHGASNTFDFLKGFQLGETDSFIFGGYDKRTRTFPFKTFLGKVMQLPNLREREGKPSTAFYADAAFVAYPSLATTNCSLTWTGDDTDRTYCLDLGRGEQIETVTPLAIRGKHNAMYTIIGSQSPTMGLEVMFSGGTSGAAAEGNRVTSGAILTWIEKDEGGYHDTYDMDGGQDSLGSDSGSPIYTVPDRDGNVRIVGILVGGVIVAGEDITIFSSWNDVMKEFDLQPIQ